MVDKNIIYKHLSSLKESLSRIRSMDFTMDMVLGDEDIQDLLDRRMQKAIEAAIDIAAHLVASEDLGEPSSAGELFILLGERDYLSKKLSKRLAQAVGFRNIIVHQYAEIDYRLAYSDLDQKLEDLEKFAKQVKKYLSDKK